MNKEKEISFLVKDKTKLKKDLVKLGAEFLYKKELKRDIYQNEGEYFLRISSESFDKETNYYLTLKSEGEPNSIAKIKEKTEIEESFSKIQIEKLIKIITLIGFIKTKSYKKIREAYLLWDCECDLDIMDGKQYLEIEFKNKAQAQKIIDNIKKHLLEKA